MKIGKRHVLLAGLVVALGGAVYLNWHLSPTESFLMPTGSSLQVSDSELGKAAYVSANASDSTHTDSGDLFAEKRLERRTTRDAALEELDKQIKDTSSDAALKAQALESRTAHIQNMQKENTIETLIKAKGFSDCMVFINEKKISVLLPEADGLTQEKVALVTEIVTAQTDADMSDITVTPVK